jgi:hypothetical protein
MAYRDRAGMSAEEVTELQGDIRRHLTVLETAGLDRAVLVLAWLVHESASHAALRAGSTFADEWAAIVAMARRRMARDDVARGRFDVQQPDDRF